MMTSLRDLPGHANIV